MARDSTLHRDVATPARHRGRAGTDRLLYAGGILLIIAAVAAAVVSFTAPGQVVLGINIGLAAMLLVGGFIVLGLAGVISLLHEVLETASRQPGEAGELTPWLVPAASQFATPTTYLEKAGIGIAPVMERSSADTADEAAANETAAPDVYEEQRTADVEALQVEAEIGPVASVADTSEPQEAEEERAVQAGAAEEAAAATAWEGEAAAAEEAAIESDGAEAAQEQQEEVAEEAALFVVEERRFRGKPARLLSDGTVEAETDEGWLRFEDYDHLREYLDAISAMRRQRS